MERKKMKFVATVSASVLLVSSLLAGCAAEAAEPGQSIAASSTSLVESESASVSRADSSATASSSSTASSSAASSSQAQATQEPQSTSPQEPAQAQAPTTQPECAPAPTPAPETPPAPAPAETVDIAALIAAAHNYAAGKGMTSGGQQVMAVNGGLTTGNAGYFNPPDVSVQSYDSALSDLKWCIDQIWNMLQTTPDFNTETSYPIYNIMELDSRVYVLYG